MQFRLIVRSFLRKYGKYWGRFQECNPLVIVWDEEKEKMEFYEIAKQTIEYFAANNEDKKMETKYSVIMGMTCYIYRIYQEIIEKRCRIILAEGFYLEQCWRHISI